MRIDKLIVTDMLSSMKLDSANLTQKQKGAFLLRNNMIKEIPSSGFWNTLDNLTESGIKLFKKALKPYKDANKIPIEIIPKQDLEKMMNAAGVECDFNKLTRNQLIEEMNKLDFFLPGYKAYTNRTFTEKGKKIYNEIVGFDFFDLEKDSKENVSKEETKVAFITEDLSNPFSDVMDLFTKSLFKKLYAIGPGFKIAKMSVKINPKNFEDYSAFADVIFEHCKTRTMIVVEEGSSDFALKDEILSDQKVRIWLDCDSINQEWKITQFDSTPNQPKNSARQNFNGAF